MIKKSTANVVAFLLISTASAFSHAENTTEAIEDLDSSLSMMTLTHTLTLPFDHPLYSIYSEVGFEYLWASKDKLLQLVHQLEALQFDGLDPRHYDIEELYWRINNTENFQHIDTELEVLATTSMLNALSHLMYGKLKADEIEPMWRYERQRPLDQRHEALLIKHQSNISTAFDQARPDFPPYQQLRSAYQTLLAELKLHEWPFISEDRPSIRQGDRDPRVVLIRERLLPSIDHPDPDFYDEALAEAVIEFQKSFLLTTDGIVGPATLRAMNMSPADKLNQIQVNLERMRWLANEMEEEMVLVDIAGAKLVYYENAQPVWETRTQVGRPARPTPLMKSRITHFTFNPTWTIPPTILRQDKLPEIRRDISYLQRNNIRVLDYSGAELQADEIDWSNPGGIMLRQDSGPANALGQVVIRFPNSEAIYLHDTPSKRLFERDQRAFSSGCIRVENALDLVSILMEATQTPEAQQIDSLLNSRQTRNVSLRSSIPVLLAYWTAEADDKGHIIFRPDIYNHDKRVLTALNAH
ncbi:murein L,D-transpeptidase [Nitrincola tibetensis]|uniref:Murein L,D-transpeptidase n=1 Tax=Nitrincola tibetensis TaxID=2219697 RepID=A0A364NQC4_9GAMM|nr:L,D-transpeptidase family protein [Nitrincola tibetensis]RAU19308.1 murein L,D-transpeptidase [Nitrincola tibetensis]